MAAIALWSRARFLCRSLIVMVAMMRTLPGKCPLNCSILPLFLNRVEAVAAASTRTAVLPLQVAVTLVPTEALGVRAGAAVGRMLRRVGIDLDNDRSASAELGAVGDGHGRKHVHEVRLAGAVG